MILFTFYLKFDHLRCLKLVSYITTQNKHDSDLFFLSIKKEKMIHQLNLNQKGKFENNNHPNFLVFANKSECKIYSYIL